LAIREVGIVGFGRCGRLAASFLAPHVRVTACDVVDRASDAAALGIAWGELVHVAAKPAVLLAVPIRALPGALEGIAPHLVPGALVVDMASVKTRPLEWMGERLPPHARWVGTHPLFGPASVLERGAPGGRIVICATAKHEAAADEVERMARGLGLQPVRATAEQHDRDMARSQALVFLLSRAMARAGIGPTVHGTPSEERLWSALSLVAGDSDELYEDIHRLNPFAAETIARLLSALRAEADRLGGAETQPQS
jgi:prephenate dehydrogenase